MCVILQRFYGRMYTYKLLMICNDGVEVLKFKDKESRRHTMNNKFASELLHKYQALFFVLVIAVFGAAYLWIAHASTTPVSLEPENGNITAPATSIADTTASKSRAIRFGTSSGTSKPIQLSQPFFDNLGGQPIAAYNAETNATLKNQLWQIAGTPIAIWWGVDTSQSHFTTAVTNIVNQAKAKKQTPIFTLYAIPDRDCNGAYSKGGFPDNASYEAWIDWFDAALGTSPAIVIVEPDAVGTCGTAQQKADRIAALKYVMDHVQASDPNAYAYVHAGSGQLNVAAITSILVQIDVGRGRGIIMNVASIGSNATESAAADAIIASLAQAGVPNMHYLIDTSRNGIGPNGQTSCNPRGLAVGLRPTTNTSDPLADAYLWVKTPGGSDGQCQAGDPPAGTFMPTLAEAMAQLAINDGIITDLPNGTVYTGH